MPREGIFTPDAVPLDNEQFKQVSGTTVGNKRGLDVYEINSSTRTAFGGLEAESKRVLINASAAYNLIPANFREFTTFSGSTGAEENEFYVRTGTTQFGYGAIQSFRSLNMQYASGAAVRFSARFPDSHAGTWQGVGLAGIGDEVSFGRDADGDFGVWHRYSGKAEVRTFQVTTAATGNEDVTFTVNDTEFTIPVTSGTVQKNAHEIATYLEANTEVFDAFQNDDTVTISFLTDGAKSGTYSASSTGDLDGTFTQVTAGVTKTSTFRKQSEWNGNTPEGFDPTKGNQFEISYSAGYGNINYFIFDFNNGSFLKVHTERWQNREETPALNQPSMRTIIYAASVGSTTETNVYCPAIACYVSGSTEPTRNPRAYSNTKAIGGTETVIFQLRNRKVYNGIQNQAEIKPEVLVVSSESNKNVIVRVYGNPTVGGTPNFQDVGTNLISEVDTAATTVSGGRRLTAFNVAPGTSVPLDLEALRIVQPPTLRLVITAQNAGNSSDITASLTWIEDL